MAYDAFTPHWKLDLLVDLGEESKKREMKRGQRRQGNYHWNILEEERIGDERK